jgi:hypothetical protein
MVLIRAQMRRPVRSSPYEQTAASITLGQLSVVSCQLYTILMKLITQSITIIAAIASVILITSTPLDDYMTPILGFLIAISVIWIVIKQRSVSKKNKQGQNQEVFTGSPIEVYTVTVALLLAIFLTGGLQSNLFFLLYFLLFGIVFLFEPAIVFVLLIGLVGVFFSSLFEGDMLSNLIKVGSLAFLSPISFFFGREFARREALEADIDDKTGQILEDTRTLKEHTRNQDAIDEIEDIEEKAKDLREN